MNLLQSFKESIGRDHLLNSKDRLLLAVSGGMDSVVLCELCYRSGYDFVLAHANFQLRGSESDRDEEFVKALGKKYDQEVVSKKFDTKEYVSIHKVSVQVAARELRYAWFYELIHPQEIEILGDKAQPVCIVTAHHLDDNIETLLMNFFKGTGILGLRGMQFRQGKILRPLLFAKKEELERFALDNHLAWVTDSSNASEKYSRNYFRQQVIPLVQKIFPEAMGNLADNIDRFGEIELLYRRSVDQYKKQLIETRGNEIHIPVLKLKKVAPLATLIYETIKDFNFTASQVSQVVDLLDRESGKYIQSSTHRIIKNRGWLIIAPNQSAIAETILIQEGLKVVDFPNGKIELYRLNSEEVKKNDLVTENSVALLDAGKMEFPLILRRWKPGDYFYPLGMKKKKKIARFLIDIKMSRTEKEKVWVLEMNRKIIWLVGMRIDDRFKIEAITKSILKIEMRMA
jgi:tRNA(Ile)-lysidine synthase